MSCKGVEYVDEDGEDKGSWSPASWAGMYA